MPNIKGVNGHGVKNYPPDDVLAAKLQELNDKPGTSVEKRRKALIEEFDLNISERKLYDLEKRLNIQTKRRNKPQPTHVRQAVIDELDRDLSKGNGPDYVKDKLARKGVRVGRDEVTRIMKEEDPTGFDVRFPGRNKPKRKRVALTALGPCHEVNCDGHEKLSKQALRMGDIGIPIYAYKCKWSDNLEKIVTVPNIRDMGAIGHLFLDYIAETGGIPIQLTTDKGTETGWQRAIQHALREVFAPDIDTDVFPCTAAIPSTMNTIIEGFWRWLWEKEGKNMRIHLERGREDHIFNPGLQWHTDLFYWIFPSLIQKELDDFKIWWNTHEVRFQSEKLMPSGHIPEEVMESPELWGGVNCRIRVPREVVDDLREKLDDDVGPREKYFRWISEEKEDLFRRCYVSIGSPRITLETGWGVFDDIAKYIRSSSAL